jgi:hypothetical protein
MAILFFYKKYQKINGEKNFERAYFMNSQVTPNSFNWKIKS